jgi:hypothetical protein
MRHKFKVGQCVVLVHLAKSEELYEIVRVLPSLPSGNCRYRIQGALSGNERVVREDEIKPA